MSPNTRLLRSNSSEIPSYILQFKENGDEEPLNYGQEPNYRCMNVNKFSQRKNTDNSYYSNKDDKEIIMNEGSQLMKSPSMGSITMENGEEKKKTAEFEPEELNPSEQNDKDQDNKNLGFENININGMNSQNSQNFQSFQNFQNLTKEDPRLSFAKRGWYRCPENLQSSLVFQKFNMGSKMITSSMMSDSNGTFQNPFNFLPYLSSKHAIPPQTLIYYPGNIFEGDN